MENVKCPFRKTSGFAAIGMTGNGSYPTEWQEITDFDNCIGEECAAGRYREETYSAHKEIYFYCSLCDRGWFIRNEEYKKDACFSD